MTNHTDFGSHEYDDLVIRFRRQTYYADDHVYHAQIIRSPVPLQGGSFRADIETQLIIFQETFGSEVRTAQIYPYDEPPVAPDPILELGKERLMELGEALNDLLPISFRDDLPRVLQYAYTSGRGLRLILESQLGDKAENLLALPWELIFSTAALLQPARSPRFAIVRRLTGAPLRSPQQIERPFHLLHLIAAGAGDAAIDPELMRLEKDILPTAVQPGCYYLIENPASVEKLRAAQLEHPAHILHFLGHGLAERTDDNIHIRSYLHFVDEDGRTQYVTGEQLQQILGDAPALQMVVLTACYTGTIISGNIAYDLVAGGFPYVVAMQSIMPQPAVGHFIRRFYAEIQNGRPPEVAVAAGRHEIASQFPGTLDWCLPVLYTGAGLAPRSAIANWIDAVNRWLTPAVFRRVWMFSGITGALHLLVALLLWLSDIVLPAPDGLFLLKAVGWLAFAPPLLSVWYYRRKELPLTSDLSFRTQLALLLRIFAAASMGIGLAVFYVGYFSIALFAGLGFWSLLSPLSRLILLIPIQLLALLLGLAQMHSHGLSFLTSDRVQNISFTLSEFILVLAGYAMLVGPPLLLILFPQLSTPPTLNLMIGLLNIALAALLYREAHRHQPTDGAIA